MKLKLSVECLMVIYLCFRAMRLEHFITLIHLAQPLPRCLSLLLVISACSLCLSLFQLQKK